jgi:hypothetical protein
MLAISATAISSGVPELGTDFLVASFELIDDQSFLVWFTRGVENGTTIANYSITGPSARTIVLAQYVIEERDGVTLNLHKGVRVYTDSPLVVGQWVLSLASGRHRRPSTPNKYPGGI